MVNDLADPRKLNSKPRTIQIYMTASLIGSGLEAPGTHGSEDEREEMLE